MKLQVTAKTRYDVECFDKHGRLKWSETFENLVVTAGLNALLTNTLKTIPGSVSWYVGLKGSGAVVAADTMASHAGWAELTGYGNATRPAFTPGVVAGGSVDNSAAKAAFTINAAATVYGAFLASDSSKGGSAGTLYGAGDFSAARGVESGDTLNVTVTPSITSS